MKKEPEWPKNRVVRANSPANNQFSENKFLRKRLSINYKYGNDPRYSLAFPRLSTNIGDNKNQRECTEE